MTAYTLTISCVPGFAMTLSRRFMRPVAVMLAVAGIAFAAGFQAGPAWAGAGDYAIGDMVIGDPEAPVTIIEYASLTCRIARLGGIGKTRFEACMNDKALGDSVLKSRIEGAEKFDVNSTPTLIINGDKHAGALEFEELDRLLKQASP